MTIQALEAIVRDMLEEAAHSDEKEAIAMRVWATRVDAAIALMRGQSEVAGYQRRCTIYDGHAWHEVTRELYEMAKTNPALTRDYEYRIVYSISTPLKDPADEQ